MRAGDQQAARMWIAVVEQTAMMMRSRTGSHTVAS